MNELQRGNKGLAIERIKREGGEFVVWDADSLRSFVICPLEQLLSEISCYF